MVSNATYRHTHSPSHTLKFSKIKSKTYVTLNYILQIFFRFNPISLITINLMVSTTTYRDLPLTVTTYHIPSARLRGRTTKSRPLNHRLSIAGDGSRYWRSFALQISYNDSYNVMRKKGEERKPERRKSLVFRMSCKSYEIKYIYIKYFDYIVYRCVHWL